MKNSKTLGVPFLMIAGCWVVLIYWIAVASMPYNPVSVPRIITINLQTICPQGWAFFTRNPREDRLFLYRNKDGTMKQQAYQNSRLTNLFGIRRTARQEAMEIAMLTENMTDKDWTHFEEGISSLDSLVQLPVKVVISKFTKPLICGEVYIEKRAPIPWAWSKDTQPGDVPTKFIKIKAVCSK